MNIHQQDTARQSLIVFREEGKAGTLADQIIEYARTHPEFSDRDLMRWFGRPRNVISGARNRLFRDGRIVPTGATKSDGESNRDVMTWKYCSNPHKRTELSAKQKVTAITKILTGEGSHQEKIFDIKNIIFPNGGSNTNDSETLPIR